MHDFRLHIQISDVLIFTSVPVPLSFIQPHPSRLTRLIGHLLIYPRFLLLIIINKYVSFVNNYIYFVFEYLAYVYDKQWKYWRFEKNWVSKLEHFQCSWYLELYDTMLKDRLSRSKLHLKFQNWPSKVNGKMQKT